MGAEGPEVGLGACEAGGRLIAAHLADSEFVAMPNWPGELAARVFRAMSESDSR